ncbi:MAG: DUF11 domain-containing protein [Ardenticatenaceae bacterium]|nr:DUF11 domain-containing protein [Ardenticatenaceae bacterium]
MKKLFSIVTPIIVPIIFLVTLTKTLLVVLALPRQSAVGAPTLIWEPTSPLKQPVNYSSAQVVKIGAKEFIYVIGGKTPLDSTNDVLIAEVLNNGTLSEWQPTASLPLSEDSGIESLKTASIGEQLYVIGGLVNGKDTNSVYCANPLTDGNISSWVTLTNNTLTPRINHAAVTVGNKIYVIGGWVSGAATNTVYSAYVEPKCGSITWEEENPMLESLANMSAVFVPLSEQKGIIYVFGGWSTSPSDSTYYAYVDLLSDGSQKLGEWHQSAFSLTQPLYFHSVVLIQNALFVFGGYVETSSGDYTATRKIYRILLDDNGSLFSSNELTSLQFDVFGHTSVVAGNQQAYIIGGERSNFSDDLVHDQRPVFYTPFAWLTKFNLPSGKVSAGDQITYTLYYTSNGLRPLTNLIITDEIPANTILIRPEYSPSTSILTWTVPSLGLNESGSVSFTVQVRPPLTAVPPSLSTSTSTPTIPSIDSGLTCSTGWSGGGGTPRPTCTPTATPIPVETTPAPTATPRPSTTRIFGLTPIPVINQAWMCEANWCIQSNPVFNAPYHFYLPLVVR